MLPLFRHRFGARGIQPCNMQHARRSCTPHARKLETHVTAGKAGTRVTRCKSNDAHLGLEKFALLRGVARRERNVGDEGDGRQGGADLRRAHERAELAHAESREYQDSA